MQKQKNQAFGHRTIPRVLIGAHCSTGSSVILIEQAAHNWTIEKLPGSHHLPLLGKVKTAE